MPIPELSIELQSAVCQFEGLVQPALGAPKRALQVKDLHLDLRVAAGAEVETSLRLDEGVIRAAQLAQDPAGVAEIGKTTGTQIPYPVGVVGLAEMADDPQRQVGQLHRLARIAENRLAAHFEQELAESPGVKVLVLLHHPQLFRVRALRQPRPELRRLAAFQDGYLLVPMADFLLQARDFLAALPADRTTLQKVRNHQMQ